MDNRRNEQSKRKAEYGKEYQKRPEIKERMNEYMKEYMRLYRARKKKEQLDAGDIVSTSVNNNNSHQTPAVSIPQTSNINNEQVTSNNLTYIQQSTKQEYIQKYSTWVGYERDESYENDSSYSWHANGYHSS